MAGLFLGCRSTSVPPLCTSVARNKIATGLMMKLKTYTIYSTEQLANSCHLKLCGNNYFM